ncbi:hypothetical protein LCGC14_0813670 [marine sediment metagenome]|uniref:Uncharacterized protein n=1 Tax=marine sediment metagenome TaxID=412755 RepID=A0A0F9PKV7_9ZZZZ
MRGSIYFGVDHKVMTVTLTPENEKEAFDLGMNFMVCRHNKFACRKDGENKLTLIFDNRTQEDIDRAAGRI